MNGKIGLTLLVVICLTYVGEVLGSDYRNIGFVQLPDLRITGIETDMPSINQLYTEATIPLKITIKNSGAKTDQTFKISIEVLDSNGRLVKPYTIQVQQDKFYPWKNGMNRGEVFTLNGKLIIGSSQDAPLSGKRIIIVVRADSCMGDESMPGYCRVKEANESNNEMKKVVNMPVQVFPHTGDEEDAAGNSSSDNTSIPVTHFFHIPFYFVDSSVIPGALYYVNLTDQPGGAFFHRESGPITSFAFHPFVPRKLYYVNDNDNKIFLSVKLESGMWSEQVVYTHSTYVRDIAFHSDKDGNPAIYFSEASGAGGNGRIFKLVNGTAVPFYDVLLFNMKGFWSGDFTFDDDGNLYLSSGNCHPARIYKETFNNVTLPVEMASGFIFRDDNESIGGMAYKDGALYYTSWSDTIYRLDLKNGIRTKYTDLSRRSISDVGFQDFSESTSTGGARPYAG